MRAAFLQSALMMRPATVACVSLGASVALHASILLWMGFSRSGPVSAEAAATSHDSVLSFTLPPQPEADPPESDTPPANEPEPAPDDQLSMLPPEPAVQSSPEPPTPTPRPKPPQVRTPAPAAKPSTTPTADRPTVFAGVQARRASRIVYVVDASGPMASSLAFVKDELARSVGALSPDQSFQVLFFRESPGSGSSTPAFAAFDAASSSAQLAPATADAKKRFRSWLGSIRPSGRSNPQPALEEAMRLGPDLVFVLSRRIKRTNLADSASEVRQVLASLDRLNPADAISGKRPVVIKTIQFLDDDPSGLLQSIAQTHGDGSGSYRLITLDELPRR